MSRRPVRDQYPALGSLAAVGDGHSVALVEPGGSLEWFCPLRFDADAAVFPLLDRRRGGVLGVGPVAPVSATLAYLEDTAVLAAIWETGTGRAQATLAMAWPDAPGAQELWWLIEGLAGDVELEVAFAPRPGFGRVPVRVEATPTGALAAAERCCLTLDTGGVRLASRGQGQGLAGRHLLRAGERLAVRLHVSASPGGPDGATVDVDQAEAVVAATVRSWRAWVAGLSYVGAWRDAVVRSAITLKMLIYEPTGAVVAAPTTSLPEQLGGERNWDYRYAWLRDAGFTLDVLYRLGAREEADRYAVWLCRTMAASGLPLRSLYGIDGEVDLAEAILSELDGYQGSRPVRVGNAAEGQLQLDVYGELLDCLAICEVMDNPAIRAQWPHFRRLADFVAEHWREPDHGIWEVRDHRRHFVHSKAMAWVALERSVRLARTYGLDGDIDRWAAEAIALHAQVLTAGVVDGEGRLGRAYGEGQLDASLLMLPIVGFLDATDPLMAATVEAVRIGLRPTGSRYPGLLWRYLPGAGDGLAGGEGAFAIASFWLVEALVLAGRWSEAQEIFSCLVDLGGPLGLYGEEIDPVSGAPLGNYPQAFTHIGLIDAALCLDRGDQPPPRGVGCHLRTPGLP
ncbi:MAG: glycoside hydrolase family 15 protein [Acidimicrobiales bacterium]